MPSAGSTEVNNSLEMCVWWGRHGNIQTSSQSSMTQKVAAAAAAKSRQSCLTLTLNIRVV